MASDPFPLRGVTLLADLSTPYPFYRGAVTLLVRLSTLPQHPLSLTLPPTLILLLIYAKAVPFDSPRRGLSNGATFRGRRGHYSQDASPKIPYPKGVSAAGLLTLKL